MQTKTRQIKKKGSEHVGAKRAYHIKKRGREENSTGPPRAEQVPGAEKKEKKNRKSYEGSMK